MGWLYPGGQDSESLTAHRGGFPMKIAMSGVGGIAGNYRQSLKRLNQPVAAVCDVNAERARQVAQEEGARSYVGYREMLDREQPDAVFIAIPPFAHSSEVADSALA